MEEEVLMMGIVHIHLCWQSKLSKSKDIPSQVNSYFNIGIVMITEGDEETGGHIEYYIEKIK